jgi:hypothetical protein
VTERLNVALSCAQKVLIIIGDLQVWNSEAIKAIQNTTGNRNRFLLDLLWDVTQKRQTLTWHGAETVEELDPNPHNEKIYKAHDRDIPRPGKYSESPFLCGYLPRHAPSMRVCKIDCFSFASARSSPEVDVAIPASADGCRNAQPMCALLVC